MKRILTTVVLALTGLLAIAQPQDGLVAYYSFDACDATDDLGNGADGIISGNAICGCGVSGSGLRLDGNTMVQFLGNLEQTFKAEFTISFFILPDPSGNSTMSILSKSEVCGIDSTLELRYNPVSKTVGLTLSQHANSSVRTTYRVPDNRCYHHITFVRRTRELLVYYDGVQVGLMPSVALVDVTNDGILTLGGSPCLANGEVPYRGVIDELRLYNRALTSSEVAELYIPSDKITSPDTILFTGTDMQVRLPSTCASSITWQPALGVSETDIAQPILAPLTSTDYNVTLDYGFCRAMDTIRITVADSSDLTCDHVFFPNGFTPNGDGLNDVWGMSNLVFLGDFISLQVFDRWGGRVFEATEPNQFWDGTLNGTQLDPGPFAYIFTYRCLEEEKRKAGSVMLIR